MALLLALVPTTAQAATQTRDDPSDAPPGAFGKADLRTVAWDLGGASAQLTVGVDESTYGAGERAPIGVHVLLDADGNGIADREIVATRNADGARIDLSLRDLDQTLSSADCQDLSGKATAAQATVATTISNGLETFTFSFDPALVPGGLTTFRWAAFGQAPPNGADAGPWDIMPDAANPDPAAANPGRPALRQRPERAEGAHEPGDRVPGRRPRRRRRRSRPRRHPTPSIPRRSSRARESRSWARPSMSSWPAQPRTAPPRRAAA